jgi:L-asparaginase
MKKRVYIVYTGGTIGMQASPAGYLPKPGYLTELMDQIAELQHADMPDITIHEYDPLLDSSNIMPSDWLKIAEDIAQHYDDYDGFVVLHGTDTMAYTASALAFMLDGLGKPVILTGSQIPLSELRNDARGNLISALLIAAQFAIPEVSLFFGDNLLRGCRAVKVDADGFRAFASPNFPALGEVGNHIEIDWSLVRPTPPKGTALRVQRLETPDVGALRLFPGISASLLENILRPPIKGLVLEAYGVGNAPDRDRDLLQALHRAVQRGVVIVACTQCLQGSVHLDDYSTGASLAKAGVISGIDMTSEAVLTKLFYLFSQGYSPDVVKSLMQKNLRGELTPDYPDNDSFEGHQV